MACFHLQASHARGELFAVVAQTMKLHHILRLDAILAQVDYVRTVKHAPRADVQTSKSSGRSSDRRDDPTVLQAASEKISAGRLHRGHVAQT